MQNRKSRKREQESLRVHDTTELPARDNEEPRTTSSKKYHWLFFFVFLVILSVSSFPSGAGVARLSLATSYYTMDVGGTAAAPLNTTSLWCPNAVCLNSDLCQPCRRRFLIVMATGRSASTTLTFMLDALPGVRMSGENNDELKAIRNMMDNVLLEDRFTRIVDRQSAWGHNPMPPGATACVGQHMIEAINPPLTDVHGIVLEDDTNTIVGFKTIRFLEGLQKGKDIRSFVTWVQENFPCTRFIVNVPSSEKEQFSSQMKYWKNQTVTDERLRALHEQNERLRELVTLIGKDQAYLLDSSKWTKNIDHLNQAVEWLGFHKSCHFQELLELNTKGYRHGKKKETHLDPDCHYLG